MDVDIKHLTETLKRAAEHKGSAFVEVYQNCVIFNDGVFDYAADKTTRADNALYLEHGKPLVFGKARDKGIRLNPKDLTVEVVPVKDGKTDALLVHNESLPEPTLAGLLSRMVHPAFPECFGVLRSVRHPTFDEQVRQQHEQAVKSRGQGKLAQLFTSDDVWTVNGK
jgi:2-oxoglutarate ferredoxin oxidoreductase subunit beta